MASPELNDASSTSSSRSSSPDCPNWIEQTQQSTENDARAQPWKKIFSDRVVDSGFDSGADVITIKRTIQESESSWSVQGNSLAA